MHRCDLLGNANLSILRKYCDALIKDVYKIPQGTMRQAVDRIAVHSFWFSYFATLVGNFK